jgi:hypothetical protein
MTRTDLYLKVVVQHDDDEEPHKIAAELCRMIQKHYSVKAAEVSNLVTHENRSGEEQSR